MCGANAAEHVGRTRVEHGAGETGGSVSARGAV